MIRSLLQLQISKCSKLTSENLDTPKTAIQAASPDEVSIVEFAESLGFKILSRSKTKIRLRDPDGGESVYRILKEFPFSSAKKRMGIAVSRVYQPSRGGDASTQQTSDEVLFYMKGADSVMIPRIGNTEDRGLIEETSEDLARRGLRTLVFGVKRLSRGEFEHWNERWGYRDIGI